jgi:tetratricopeptide (TPR) repeat protein
MTYLGSDKKLREIAEELGVATILNGGVQRAANEIRINVQLIDAATDASLWGETYTRDLTADNIFKIQSEISRAIANALQAVLSPEEQEQLDKLPTTDLAALEAYFKGVTASSPETAENIAEAVAHYQRAIELDPAFALAYARLARDYLVQVNYGFSTEDQIAMAQPLVDKALELDPQLSEAYDALGILRRYQLDFAGSEAAYQRAIELNPNNAIAYRGYSVLLRNYSADPEKSLVMARKARELNPDTPIWKAGEAVALRDLGHMNESRALLKTLVRDHPDYSQGYDWLGTTYRDDFGLHDQAIVAFRRAHALDPRFPWPPLDIAMTYERLGAREEEIFWLERTLALAPEDRFALRHRVRLLIIKGELAEADALWWREWRPSATPPWAVNNSWELEDLMNAEFAAGRFDASRARFFKRFPDWFEPDAVIPDDRQGLFSVRNVARALIATGEQQQADYLLDQIIEKLDASPESTNTLYLRAVVPAIKDDHAEAMRAIHRYVAFAGVPSDNLYSDAEFHPLYSNPEFQAVFGDVEGKRKKQLEHIRAMKANGELAPIPPLPGK